MCGVALSMIPPARLRDLKRGRIEHPEKFDRIKAYAQKR